MHWVGSWVAVALCALGACGKTEPPSKLDVAPRRPSAVAVARGPAPIADTSFRLPAAERIVAFGDLHGDVQAAREALRLGGAIDSAGRWIGGRLVVVQTGDQLDRGDDEPDILDLFERLRAEAKAAGGALIALNGNHEIMNVEADFRYVTPDGFRDFNGVHADAEHAQLAQRVPAEQRGRAAAFLPGGEIAKRLAVQPVVIQVGDNVFVHGGVLEQHVDYGLGRINQEVQRWMLGAASERAPSSVTAENALIWVRDYSDGIPLAGKCEQARRVLDRLSAKRLIMGHTVQKQGINSVCGGTLWRIDVGLSRFYGGATSVLEIRGDELHVLSKPQEPEHTAGSASSPK